jgi:hypothetical protein
VTTETRPLGSSIGRAASATNLCSRPEAEKHKCQPSERPGDPAMAAYQKRHDERIKARAEAEAKAAAAPRPCDDCQKMITPGTAHACGFRPDVAWQSAQAPDRANLIAFLKSEGFTVDKPAT